jgi:hypothetical protein
MELYGKQNTRTSYINDNILTYNSYRFSLDFWVLSNMNSSSNITDYITSIQPYFCEISLQFLILDQIQMSLFKTSI